MFTGIVESTGKLLEIQRLREGVRINILAPFHFYKDGLKISHPEDQRSEGSLSKGDSIAINGVCLTVSDINPPAFWVDVSPETLSKTYFLTLPAYAPLNLERSLKLSDRLGGHFVTGHIDTMAEVIEIEKMEDFIKYKFQFKEKPLVIPKGSIAIDGISLTVNEFKNNKIEVMVIPETLRKTILEDKKIGDPVHVEFDMIGKYVRDIYENRN